MKGGFMKGYFVVLQDGRLSPIPPELVEKYLSLKERKLTPFSKLEIVEREIGQEKVAKPKGRAR